MVNWFFTDMMVTVLAGSTRPTCTGCNWLTPTCVALSVPSQPGRCTGKPPRMLLLCDEEMDDGMFSHDCMKHALP